MRVAFVYDGIYPFAVGGFSKRIHDIAKKLAERGHEVHLYGMKFWRGPDVLLNDGVFIHGVCPRMRRYVNGRRVIRTAVIFAYGVLRALMREEGRFDVIDSGMAPILHQPSVLARARLRAEGLVLTCVEVWGDYWYDYLGTLCGGIGLSMEKLFTRMPDLIVAISEKVRDDLVSLGADARRIRVVENGVDFKRIQRIRPAEESSDIIFVGRLVPHKRVDMLLRAVRLLKTDMPDIRCLVVGEGPERPRLEKMAEELGLTENVRFLGHVEDHDDVIALMKASKVFVLPSTREGFPNTILEANASGLPVLVVIHPKNAGAWAIRNCENGLRAKLSEHDIAEKIRVILSDEVLLARMRRSALEFAKEHDWDVIVDKLEAVYRELL